MTLSEITPLVCLISLLAGALFGSTTEKTAQQSNPDVLAREYTLTPQYEKGYKSYYSHTDSFAHFGASGKVERRETVTGYFTQEVVGFRPDDTPVFRIIRNHTRMSLEPSEQEEAEPVVFDFGENFSYEMCFEDDFDYLPLDTSRLPNSMLGFMMFENIVHSHHFAILATQTHGALGQLRKVGATVTIPDSGKGGGVSFPGLLTIVFVRGQSTMTFLGLSQYRGEPAALLSYEIPLQFPEISGGTGKGTGSARATGLLWISLRRGEVLRGYLRQTTNMALQGPDGTSVPGYVETEGWLEKISQEEYPVKTK